MTAINYNAPARLWKDMLGDTAPGKLAHLYQQEVDFGTLRSCVDAFDAKPNCQKGLYSIQTDDSANVPKTTLFRQDIEALLS